MGQYFDRFEVEIYDLKGSLILQKEIHHQRIFPFTIEEEFEDYKKVINAAADFNKAVIYLTEKS